MSAISERDLINKLDKILKKQFGTNLAFHEFSAGYGIADLVFAPDFSFKKGMLKRKPITDFSSLTLLLTLSENISYSEDDIVNLFPQFTRRGIHQLLNTLTMNQYLIKTSPHSYCKIVPNSPLNPIKKIIAIEAKLRDHRNGLIQARRYQYFADESYLAILKEAEKNINGDEFNKHNIGLILFDTSSNTIEIVRPKPTNSQFRYSVGTFAKEMMLNQFMNFAS